MATFTPARMAQRHQFLIRRDHGLLVINRGLQNLLRDRGASHQFHDDIHFRVRGNPPPVERPFHRAERFRKLDGVGVQAGHNLHAQAKSEFERDLAGVLGQDCHGAGTDVAEADDSYVHVIH